MLGGPLLLALLSTLARAGEPACAPFEQHPAAVGLQGASRHLIDSLEAIRTPA